VDVRMPAVGLRTGKVRSPVQEEAMRIILRIIRSFGSLAFVLGAFTAIFGGLPWYLMESKQVVLPLWLKVAILCVLGGMLLVLMTLALERRKDEPSEKGQSEAGADGAVLLLNSDAVPGRETREILGLVQGHTVFAIWLGKDLSALIRLVLGGELTEYTEMMGKARTVATDRMIAEAARLGADAVINVRYMTTSVVGSAAELLVYGTAVKVNE